MKTMINNQFFQCDEQLECTYREFIHNIYGKLVPINKLKYRIILTGPMEFMYFNENQVFTIKPKTLITSNELIDNNNHELIENVNNNYIYRLNIKCILCSKSINNNECSYIFEEINCED